MQNAKCEMVERRSAGVKLITERDIRFAREPKGLKAAVSLNYWTMRRIWGAIYQWNWVTQSSGLAVIQSFLWSSSFTRAANESEVLIWPKMIT